MNMFRPAKAKSAKEYFAVLSKERRVSMEFLHKFIRRAVPKLKLNFIYNMPGYGTFQYRSYKKCLIGRSSRLRARKIISAYTYARL